MGQETININSIEFVQSVFRRILPGASIRVIYDLTKSLQATIEVNNPEYPPLNLDLKLFIERYEKHGIIAGDEQTKTELRLAGTLPIAPPVSTGQGVPAADPFAAPAGGFDSFNDRVKKK